MGGVDVLKGLGPRFEAVAGDGSLALRDLGLTPGARVLDVGTGSGNFAVFLATQGFDVTTGEPATDASQYARRDWAQLARQAGVADRIRFEPFDASAMPFEPGAFDAAFFFGVLHHIPEPARAAALREAMRVTKSVGPIVVLEPRQAMLQVVRATDPAHPPAADPRADAASLGAAARRIEGAMMDVYILTRPT